MAAKLLTEFKQKIETLELQPSGGGCFEVTADGKVLYSKLKTGSFPDEEALVKQVGKLL